MPDQITSAPTARLTRSVYEDMVAHALEERPFEGCGLLAGSAGLITTIYRCQNAADFNGVRYEIAPRDILRITREIDDADLELLAIYHSHPYTRAYPSATDVSIAGWPVFYILVSLVDFRHPVVKAYTIEDGTVTEVPVEVE